jgi:GNAT superfamily N-acetyltransferase
LTEFWELDGNYVDPKFQRRGPGTQLLHRGIEQARLENIPIVMKSSPVGSCFYEQHGFKSYRQEPSEPFFEVGERGMHLMV